MLKRSQPDPLPLILAFVTVFLTIGPSAQGQAPRGRGRGLANAVVDQTRQALDGLDLTPEQRSKIDPILTAAVADARGRGEEMAGADAPTRRGRARGMMVELRDKIVPVLTPEQAKTFEQKLQELGPPVARGGAAGQRPIGQVVESLYDFVSKLDLNEQQKPQVERLFSETRQKLVALRQQPPGDGTGPQRLQAIVQELRDQLATTLSPDQQLRLRDMIAQDDALPVARGRGARGRGMLMQPDAPAMGDAMKPNAPGAAPAPSAQAAEVPGVPVGQPAPDFTLNNIDGKPVSLASYKGKIVLLVFGSYSSPLFRQRAAALEQLRTSYGARINVITIYTKENYPVGQWDTQRNKDDGIAIEQATTAAARLAEAKRARTTLHLTAPMLVDTMDDSTATAYGGFTNAAVLIGRTGTVLARQKWFEPYALRRQIDEALK